MEGELREEEWVEALRCRGVKATRCKVEGEEVEEEPVTDGRRRKGGRKSKLRRLLINVFQNAEI